MSLVIYNSIQLPYSIFTDFRQEVVYDESNTDWYLTRYNITVQAIINTNYLLAIAPFLAGENLNAAQIMTWIRTSLLKPRQRLSVTLNGIEMIPYATYNRGNVDAKNGPQPQACNIVQMSNETFLIHFSIIAHYWDKPAVVNAGNVRQTPGDPILYCKWSETVDLDSAMYTTRTRQGKYVMRSDVNQSSIIDEFRYSMAALGVPKGFIRQSSQYKVDPSGLALEFSIVDKEVFKMPPQPAFEAQGEYIESTTNLGAVRHAEVWCQLRGAKTTNQMDLIAAAVRVCARKICLNGIQTDEKSRAKMLELAVVLVNMYENVVQCRMRGRMKPGWPANGKERLFKTAGIAWNALPFTPLSDGVPAGAATMPEYKIRGTASLLLQAAAYYDPSLNDTIMNPATGQLNKGLAPGQAGAIAE